jgi:ribosomal protein S18 acetylase RimI-like enzyme
MHQRRSGADPPRLPAQRRPGRPVTHPLDNPVLASLTGPHASLALTRGRAARYPADVSPFCALPGEPDAADWADAARLLGGEAILFPALRATPPPDWEVLGLGEGVQLVATTLDATPDPEAVPLGPADVPDMLSLTRLAQPGPFLSRTIELGAYLGIRRDGQLIAMAGERMRPPGWTEISAVCTDPAWRGQGLASRLTRAVAAGIAARGDTPFLHAIAANTTAIRLYKELGFTHRRDVRFPLLRPVR